MGNLAMSALSAPSPSRKQTKEAKRDVTELWPFASRSFKDDPPGVLEAAFITSLFASLVCFRLGDGALSADIAKFYNQTQLEASYLQYQRILWPRAYLAEGGKGGGEGE